jgi:tripartite-type tricarboxylate transporter receptor subunit TctC
MVIMRLIRLPCASLLFIILLLFEHNVNAQNLTYPNRPIRVIIPVAPGGNVDSVMRLISPKLSELLGQSVILDNRPGASTNIGNEFVAKSAPDGYTLLANTIPLVANSSLYAKLSYDSEKDFAPISMMVSSPSVIAVNANLPVKTMPELIAMAKKNPGMLKYSTSGAGGITHLAVELLAFQTGTKFVHIPYKGGGPALMALMSGEVDLSVLSVLAAAGQMSSQRIRVLAVTSSKRLPMFPDIPSVNEFVTGYEFNSWVGLLAPKSTPPAVVQMLNEQITKVLNTPDITEKIQKDGGEVLASTPEQFKKIINFETSQWAKVIQQAGITPD